MEDHQEPLNPKSSSQAQITKTQSTEGQEKKLLLNVKVEHKKHVMSLMDTLLTLLIVSPLIVGHWRGTWTLMDVYERAFPAWESFLFGGSLHLSFAIMRDGLQDLIKFKNKSFAKTVLVYSLRRLYTYLFAVACIMNWRGGWIIFDEWFGVEMKPDGTAIPGKSLPVIIGVFFGSMVLLGVLRSCRNILAAPFVIGLDTKSSAFDFPTRYRITISYTTLYAVNSEKPIENTNATSKNVSTPTPNAEKLTSSDVTIEKQEVEHISPRPFINDLRGAPPSGFSPGFGPPTTPKYPQITNHQIPTQPHNIQEIIQYLSQNAHRQKELIREEQQRIASDKFKLFGTFQGSRGKPQETKHFSFPQDPFFPYKPQDPSDINLLAPSNFRFAPAILSTNFRKNRQKIIQEAENIAHNTTHLEVAKKPLSLTLNIYPSPFGGDFESESRFRFPSGPPGGPPRIRHPPLGLQLTRNMVAPKKMVVHLNVFPGAKSTNGVHPGADEYERRFQKRIRNLAPR